MEPETNSNEAFEGSRVIPVNEEKLEDTEYFSDDASFVINKEMIGFKNEDALSDSNEDQNKLDDSEYFLG